MDLHSLSKGRAAYLMQISVELAVYWALFADCLSERYYGVISLLHNNFSHCSIQADSGFTFELENPPSKVGYSVFASNTRQAQCLDRKSQTSTGTKGTQLDTLFVVADTTPVGNRGQVTAAGKRKRRSRRRRLRSREWPNCVGFVLVFELVFRSHSLL